MESTYENEIHHEKIPTTTTFVQLSALSQRFSFRALAKHLTVKWPTRIQSSLFQKMCLCCKSNGPGNLHFVALRKSSVGTASRVAAYLGYRDVTCVWSGLLQAILHFAI